MTWSNQPLGSERPYLDGEVEADLFLREKLPYADGSGYCYRFADHAGHCIVWFSKRRNPNLDVGAAIRARFVIKGHRIYDGVLENIVKKLSITGPVPQIRVLL